jgi:hypothetical protein
MGTEVSTGKALLKIARFVIKLLLLFIRVALEISSESKNPVCGAAEAHARRERGTITPDEFYKATNKH